MVILTDGSATDYYIKFTKQSGRRMSSFHGNDGYDIEYNGRNAFIVSGSKNFPLIGENSAGKRTANITLGLLDYLKATCGVSVTGFFIGNNVRNALLNYSDDINSLVDWRKIEDIKKKFNSDKSITFTDCGYDELHYVSGKTKDLGIDNEDYFEGETNENVKEAVKDVKSALKKIGTTKKQEARGSEPIHRTYFKTKKTWYNKQKENNNEQKIRWSF